MAAQREAAAWLMSTIHTGTLLNEVDAWIQLIEFRAEADPRRECRATAIGPNQDYVIEWIETRNESIAAYWGF